MLNISALVVRIQSALLLFSDGFSLRVTCYSQFERRQHRPCNYHSMVCVVSGDYHYIQATLLERDTKVPLCRVVITIWVRPYMNKVG